MKKATLLITDEWLRGTIKDLKREIRGNKEKADANLGELVKLAKLMQDNIIENGKRISEIERKIG